MNIQEELANKSEFQLTDGSPARFLTKLKTVHEYDLCFVVTYQGDERIMYFDNSGKAWAVSKQLEVKRPKYYINIYNREGGGICTGAVHKTIEDAKAAVMTTHIKVLEFTI